MINPLGDVLADSGYVHRDADAWALPLRAADAALVQDLTRTTAAPKAPAKAPSSATGPVLPPDTTPAACRVV